MKRVGFLSVMLLVSLLACAEVKQLTTLEFAQKVMQSKRPVVIDFYTTWCGPCKMMSPIMEKLSTTYSGKVDFYKVDIEQERELADLFGITSIPTFIFWPVGQLPKKKLGAVDEQKMEGYIKSYLIDVKKK